MKWLSHIVVVNLDGYLQILEWLDGDPLMGQLLPEAPRGGLKEHSLGELLCRLTMTGQHATYWSPPFPPALGDMPCNTHGIGAEEGFTQV